MKWLNIRVLSIYVFNVFIILYRDIEYRNTYIYVYVYTLYTRTRIGKPPLRISGHGSREV